MTTAHWLFGDQLGPHLLHPADSGPAPQNWATGSATSRPRPTGKACVRPWPTGR